MLDIKRIKRDLEEIKPLMAKRGEKDFRQRLAATPWLIVSS